MSTVSLERLKRILGDAMAKHTDFRIWFMRLEEHHKRGIEGVVKDMVWAMRPKWLPKWLWERLIRRD